VGCATGLVVHCGLDYKALLLTPHALDGWYAPRPQALSWLVILSTRGSLFSPPASNVNR